MRFIFQISTRKTGTPYHIFTNINISRKRYKIVILKIGDIAFCRDISRSWVRRHFQKSIIKSLLRHSKQIISAITQTNLLITHIRIIRVRNLAEIHIRPQHIRRTTRKIQRVRKVKRHIVSRSRILRKPR